MAMSRWKRASVSVALACGTAAMAFPSPPNTDRMTQTPDRVAREATLRMDDGVELYYRSVGSGREVVVIPVAVWTSPHFDRLATGDRRLVYYDPRGRGRSGVGDLKAASLARATKDLETLRTKLGIDRMALIGWSGYGMEAAVYALEHPERVTRIVQLNPVPPRQEPYMSAREARIRERVDGAAWQHYQALIKKDAPPAERCMALNRAMAPAFFAKPERAASTIEAFCAMENEWPERQEKFFQAFLPSLASLDLRPRLRELKMPRLVIHGERDLIALEGVREWIDASGSSRLLVVPNADHGSFLDEPDVVFPAIEEFLSGRQPSDRATHGLSGDPTAVATARRMIEAMGGAKRWAAARWIYAKERAYYADRTEPDIVEFWRATREPAQWARSSRPRSSAWASRGGWRLLDGRLAEYDRDELQQRLGWWRGEIYVMYHRLAAEDPNLRLVSGGERRFIVLDGRDGSNLGAFTIGADGGLIKWTFAYGTSAVEYVYGPLKSWGEIRMPDWGALVDGTFRFYYTDVRLAEAAPDVSFDKPSTQ